LYRALGDVRGEAEALRHLGITAHMAGRLDEARERLEESSRLRREIWALPGVATNMVGLAYIAATQDHAAAVTVSPGHRGRLSVLMRQLLIRWYRSPLMTTNRGSTHGIARRNRVT
jgi:hypothetical protein